MDSLRKRPVTYHLKDQVSATAQCENSISIRRPPCKQQSNMVDCGLFAIANATEFCFTKKINFVDFDNAKLRGHWLDCMKRGVLTQFPRRSSRPKKTREEDEITKVRVYCPCRLPEPFGNMIECESCQKWYHFVSINVDEGYKGSFIRKSCMIRF